MTVCDDIWNLFNARVTCRMLGFVGALDAPRSAMFGQGSGDTIGVNCLGTEDSLQDCVDVAVESYCGHHKDASAVCYSGVRLVGGPYDAEGRVQVLYDGSWGTICDDTWDLRDARVVCRMLGFDGALDAPGSARFGEGSGDILLDDVGCEGTEDNLADCAHLGIRVHNCGHGDDASAVCYSGDPFQVRLVNGSNDAEGRVEVRHDVSWGTVCDDLWDLRDARVVCRMLGFDGALDAPGSARFGQGSGDILLDDPFQVRLASGSNDVEGRVVVMYEGSWGTICDVGWDLRDARVVCRMLGFGGALDAPISARFGQGSGRILLANVGCEGTEANLADCAHRGIGDYCDHRRDAGAICYSGVHPKPFQVRFVGGSNDSQGRVEVLHDGSWGTICDDSWDLRDASVVCIMLGFDGALDAPTSARFGQGSGHVLLTYVSCDGTEGNLADCAHAGIDRYPCSHLRDAGAVCYSGAIEVDRTKLNSANKQES
ncbi:deleted in malignant brain tumors 1 protein-like [Strongylocentrotus purpuratus]|uniref:SRCR domain-containing protein n=1 Tax=Strongylocentrotus purpuratus TaxID=7668 RepID=A0A7M7PKB0_STRPU|nr:deleted in malignant brain tumors 1 protein-like [Strongylocentrotus purpuratus]